MHYNGKRMKTFDIESTGLDINSNIVCICTFDGKEYKTYYSIKEFMKQDFTDKILVGFNSGNYRGGFDLNFIRTKCIQDDIDYKLKGVEHLDIYPLVKSYFNTTIKYNKIPSLSSLLKKDLEWLAEANELLYSTKKETYEDIMELDEPEWLNYVEEKHKEKNSLQDVYQQWFDPNKIEEYISGADTDELLQQKAIGDVVRHCCNDNFRTYKITNTLIDLLPNYQIDRSIEIL